MNRQLTFRNKLYIFVFLYTIFISIIIFINFSNFNKTTNTFRNFIEKNNSIQSLNKTILKFKNIQEETLLNISISNPEDLIQKQKKLKTYAFQTSKAIRKNMSLIEKSEFENLSIIQEYLDNLMNLEEKITSFILNFDSYINSLILGKRKNLPFKINIYLDNSLVNLNISFEKVYFELLRNSENNILKQRITLFFTNLMFILISIFFFRLYKTHILNRFTNITKVLDKIKFKSSIPISLDNTNHLNINDEVDNIIKKLVSLNNELKESENIIQKKNTTLKNINQKLINKLEEDRNEISQIIHNNLGQYLIAINLDLIALRNSIQKKETQEKITTCISLIKDSLGSLKETTSFISAPHILTLDFKDAIEMHCKNFQNHYICKLNLIYKITKYDLNKEKKLVLFRCIQEGLNNIAKHSKANDIYIKLFKNKHNLYLGIRDNGAGLSNDYIPSLGHTSLEQRVLSLSGQFKIKNNYNSKGISMLIKI